MREYFQQHPVGFGLLMLCLVTILTTLAVLVFAFYTGSQPCVRSYPGDPCDAPAMLFVSLVILSPFIGFAVGTVAGLIGWYYMRLGRSFHREIPTIK
ncbi:MAG: hypothetical protein AB7Q37_00745 [Pyrinomonadaceae bacterium]